MAEPPLSAEAAVPAPAITFKKRGARPKENLRKREKPDSSSEDSSSDDDLPAGGSRKAKRRPGIRAAAESTAKPDAELFRTTFQADRGTDLSASNDATRQKTKIGPTHVSTNVRSTTMMDYAPDVCKDYKQTGFCGFGDNCKYLHDRSDYKHGWQLDKDWENVTKGKKNLGGTVVASANRTAGGGNDDEYDDEEGMLDNIPFACIICREPYKSPVVTRCGHYFCEACALKRYRKDPGCAACGAGTSGVFNSAARLKKLLERKRERERKRREAAIEAGEEVSSEEEEGG